MARNVEIKARTRDLGRIEDLLRSRGAEGPTDLVQVDVFFRAANGRLKLRKFGDGTGELIQYQRADREEPGESRYTRVPAPEPELLERALAESLGVRGVVEKERRLYLLGPTRIHLDRVRGLGEFLELEVVLAPDQPVSEGVVIADRLASILGIDESDRIACAYIDLLSGEA